MQIICILCPVITVVMAGVISVCEMNCWNGTPVYVCFRSTRRCSCLWWRRLWLHLCFTTLTVFYCSHCGEVSLLQAQSHPSCVTDSYSKAAVLNSSPRTPPLCIFRMLLLSLQMFVPFVCKCTAKCTSQYMLPWFQFEANVYIPFKVHWSVQDVNSNCIYLQRYMMSHSSVREDVAQRKSMNECPEIK